MKLNSKYGEVRIFTDNIEQDAISQVIELANSPLGENAHIRIMPDVHAGKGCVIGTTMKVTDKVCPNIVGVDIGCGVALAKTNLDFGADFKALDTAIRKYVPSGMNSHDTAREFKALENLKCFHELPEKTINLAYRSLGTLGGGNHFIEAYENGYISVHSGSRNIGLCVAKHYQKIAEDNMPELKLDTSEIQNIAPEKRSNWIAEQKARLINEKCPTSLAYLTGDNLADYLHDVAIMQQFAKESRASMLNAIVSALGGKIEHVIESVHNYIDIEEMIIRKGAISAKLGEQLVIPMNMRDGLLVCVGRGNDDWNNSAPHGAGRLYSRSLAKEIFDVEEYKETMKGIYTTCVSKSTIDEAPFVYKNYQEILENVKPTVDVIERLLPIFNFKAN